MNKKYWIIFLVLVNIILIAGVIVYFKVQGKELFPKKIEIPLVEKKAEEVIDKNTKKSAFIAHGVTPKEQKLLGDLFDKMSDKKDDADIAFISNTQTYYFYSDKKVYWYKRYTIDYEKVDCKRDEFKLLDNSSNTDIGICGKAVFIRGIKDYRIDGESFEVIYGDYVGDKKKTYFKHKFVDPLYDNEKVELVPVEGNPTSIESAEKIALGIKYALANGKLLFGSKLYPKIDIDSLKRIDGFYYTDKAAYYFMSEKDGPLYITDNTAKISFYTFSDIHSDKYAKIGKNAYLRNVKLTYAMIDRLKPFDAELRNYEKPKLASCTTGCNYVWDGKNIYFEGKRLNADPKTFRLIGYGIIGGSNSNPVQPNYAKDKNYIYFGDKTVVGADPITFEPIVSGKYYFEFGKDKSNVYFEDKKINKADPRTFTPLAEQPYEGCVPGKYSKDKSNVYFKWDIVKDADSMTFKVITAENGAYGKDDENYYHRDNKAKENDWGECIFG